MNAQNYTANYLLKARLKRNMTQQQFADFIGVTQATVSSWERGATAPTQEAQLSKLCKALKITPKQLFPYKECDSGQISISETANTKPYEVKRTNGLKDLRERTGLSQIQVGEKIGYVDTTISRWEHGACNLPAEAYRPLCEVYNVTMEELLDAAANRPADKKPPETPLEAARLRARKSIAECAELLNFTAETYQKVENDILTVTVGDALRLANFLGVDDFNEFKRCFTNFVFPPEV